MGATVGLGVGLRVDGLRFDGLRFVARDANSRLSGFCAVAIVREDSDKTTQSHLANGRWKVVGIGIRRR